MKNLYDDDKIPLVATIRGEPSAVAKVKEVKFIPILIKDGVETEEAPITAPVKKGFPASEAKHDFQPPPVDDGLDFYEVKYRVEIDNPGKPATKMDGAETFKIWPTKVEVTLTADDNKAHKKCRFKIKKGGALGLVKTSGDDGKWSERIGTSTWELVAEPPYALVDPITHKGKKRSYKVKKNLYKVEFITPVIKDATKTIKQYVNLDLATGGWTETNAFGHQLSFKVGAEGDTKRGAGAKLGQKDDHVYIEVNFTPATKRNDPQPKLLDDGLDGAAVASNSNNTWKGKIKLGADATATFKVELGYAGGDIVEIKIGGDDTCADAKLKFQTWRRLFYELMYPDILAGDMKDLGGGRHDYPDNIKSLVDARLAAAFIEYQLKASHQFAKAKAPKGTLVPPEFIGRPAGGRECFVQGGELGDVTPSLFKAAEDRTIHVTVADKTVSTNVKQKPESPELTAASSTFKNGSNFAPLKVDVAACSWTAVIPNPALYHQFPTMDAETVTAGDAVNRACEVKVEEVNQKKSLLLTFARGPNNVGGVDLSPTEAGKVGPFIQGLLVATELKKYGNKLKLKITNPDSGAPGEATRATNVQVALQTAFNTHKAKVYAHPGLDENGAVRTGAVDAKWFTAEKINEIRINLPTSPNGVEAKPGDFAGALSATKCKVKVAFKVTIAGSINGNSGSGEQLFQLLPAPRTKGALASTICHELGHSMGMTIMAGRSKIPPGTDPALHIDSTPTAGTYYRNADAADYTQGIRPLGKGAHCASGVVDIDDEKFSGQKGSCIMFHEGGDADSRQAYCATCQSYLQARKLVNVRAAWTARGAADY